MKKIIFFIITFCFLLLPVKALEEIPQNIYYVDNDLYAYLEKSDIESTDKIYIEYRLTKGEITKILDMIEITELPLKTMLLKSDDELFDKNIEIESRYVINNEEKKYSEWSKKEKITDFDFSNMPSPKISNMNISLEYNIDNKEEIEKYFETFAKIYDFKVLYKTEYKINDLDWKEEKPVNYNPEDVKLEIRVRYEVGKYKSEYSNTLIYEKHPEIICPFGSDICCNQILNFSLCYWISIFAVVLVSLLIYIDNRKRLKREA